MNEKQKDNLAKFAYDLARIIAGVAVITPLVQSGKGSILNTVLGLIAVLIFLWIGYAIDSNEVTQ
jgi:nicotinamide riboside transporter PnuC